MDGFTFRLSTETKKKLEELQANPSGSLYLTSSVKNDFDFYHGSIIPHVFPSLAGFSKPEDEKWFSSVEFIDPLSGKTLHMETLHTNS